MARIIFVAIIICTAPAFSDVRLPKIIGSKMVLQQNSEVKIWGWAEAGEVVEVHCDWLDVKYATKTNADGRWHIKVKTAKAGGPHSIKIKGNNLIELDDILFGEVWIASGQSNMEMPLISVSGAYTGIKNFEKEVKEAKYPNIRLFQVGNFSSKEPLDDVQTGIEMYGVPKAACTWQECSPKTIPTFASTAYFFARHLHQKLKVPIGIIDSSWGGTPAEAWTPVAGLKKLDYQAELKAAAERPQKADQKIPSRLYNGMIHPLRHVKIRGVIWYQGEGNSGRAGKYEKLFTTMIQQWRAAFDDDFSFYFVQISPFNYGRVNSAELRDAQRKTLSLANTGMVVTLDIGNLKDIHPKNKQEVGRRLALWALAKNYQKETVFSGPLFKESVIDGTKIRVKFDHAQSGLATSDKNPPSHFEIAGSDNVFHPATALIEGKDVVVSSDKVGEPKFVRYAFSNQATGNLISRGGLPASSFQTGKR